MTNPDELKLVLPAVAYDITNICNPEFRKTNISIIWFDGGNIEIRGKLKPNESISVDLEQIKLASKFFEECLEKYEQKRLKRKLEFNQLSQAKSKIKELENELNLWRSK